MREYQKGEVTLVVMVAMMAIVWMVSGHMGMMGMGHEKLVAPTAESGSAASAVPATSPEHSH